jgi:hypothetical protein
MDSIHRRCFTAGLILWVPILAAYGMNRYLFQSADLAARLTAFGSLGLWVSLPYVAMRQWAGLKPRRADNQRVASWYWTSIGIALFVAVFCTLPTGLRSDAWFLLWEVSAFFFAMAATFLAVGTFARQE